jgi:hypothetical protein
MRLEKMKNDMLKRIEWLESKNNLGAGINAIFLRFVKPGQIDQPVAGWAFGDWDNRVQVLRKEGEAEDDLRKRAIALAREHIGLGKVPSLTSIR